MRGRKTFLESYPQKYEQHGIHVRDYDNPKKLIGFSDLVRYLHETNPALVRASEADIYQCLPKDLPQLLNIPDFHYSSTYNKGNPPSKQELYQLIAKTLVTRDTSNWKPTQKPNNHWSNWESGNL